MTRFDYRTPEQIARDAAEHERTLRELVTNDPPVRPGQVWSIRDDEDPVTMRRTGGLVRADRILAMHPDPKNTLGDPDPRDPRRGWIVEPAKVPQAIRREGLGVMPEYNLRRLFRLDADLSTGASLEGVDPSYWDADHGLERAVRETSRSDA